MARRFITGLETNSLAVFDWTYGANIVAAKSGMTGNYCLDLDTDNNSYAAKDLGSSMSEVYLYCLIHRTGGATYGPPILGFLASDEGEAFYLYTDTTNYYLQAAPSYSGSVFANSSPTGLTEDVTHRLELYFKPSTGSDGRLVVKLNGTTVIDFTGITSTKTNVKYLALGNVRRQAFANGLFYFDDIIVDDAQWITGSGEQPHKVTAIFPSANGAVNDLSVSSPVNISADNARWLFESGDLGNDEKGNADLTLYGSPSADSGDKQQGSSSIKLVRASSQYGKVTDASLPSGFPLKSGETNRVFTMCFWVKPDTLPGSGVYHEIFCKSLFNSDACFEVQFTNSKLRLIWGYSATSQTTWDVFTATADKWVFCALFIHGDNRTWRVRVYDPEAATWTTYTGSTAPGTLHISARDIHIGSYDGGTNCLDGWLDNFRIYPVILTDEVVNLIRQNRDTFERYEVVRILPSNDAQYLYGHTDDAIQTFVMDDLVGSVESVKAVRLYVRNYLTGDPTVNKVTPLVRIGGTNYLGDAVQAPAWLRPENNSKLWELNPATSSAWIKDDIDGMECGFKLTDT